MGVNFALLAIGLVICFGGIYLRRICSGVLGFVWGVLGTFIFVLLTMGMREAGDDGTLIAAIVCGFILAIVSAVYYKACAAINGFLSAFSIVFLLLALADAVDSPEVALFIAAIIGIVVAIISYRFYDYSFIIITALSGAFVASIGGFGLIKQYDAEEMIMRFLWYGFDDAGTILIATIILGIVGFLVQLHRLKNDTEQAA